MKAKYKRYILENINKKSIDGLARELKLKQRSIRKLLEKETRKKRPLPNSLGLEQIPRPNKIFMLVSILIIITIGFVAYSNSLKGQFIWDDKILIQENAYLKDLRHIPKFFTGHIAEGHGEPVENKCNSYRPLQMMTYALNYAFGKFDLRTYHLTNIVFHILAALVLFWLVQLLCGNTLLSLISSALFVSHPIHTEAVTYISGRADPMAALFMLLMAIFYIKFSRTNKQSFYVFSIIFYIMAILSKEIALLALLIIVAYDYIYQEKSKLLLRRYAPFLAIGGIYAILRTTVLWFPTINIVAAQTTVLQRLSLVFDSLARYFKLLILPRGLHMEYELIVPSIMEPRVVLGMIIALLLVFVALKTKQHQKLVAFSIAWFFINYIPVSNIFPLNATFSEHWIYAPSMGLFILAAWAAIKVGEKQKVLKWAVCAGILSLVALSSTLTIKQNLYWQEPEAFFRRTLQCNPEASRVMFELSLICFESGRIDEGIELAEKGIKIDPSFTDLRQNLAHAYTLKGWYDKAIEQNKKAIALNPNSVIAHRNLAEAYFKNGQPEKAVEELKMAISLRPNQPVLYEFLGKTCAALGRAEEAIAAFGKAAEINPDQNMVMYNNLATLCFHEKKYNLAIRYADKAKELGFVNLPLLESLEPYRENKLEVKHKDAKSY